MTRLSYIQSIFLLLCSCLAPSVLTAADASAFSHVQARMLPSEAVQFVANVPQRSLVMGYTDHPVAAGTELPSNLQQWLSQVDEAARFTTRHPEYTLGTTSPSAQTTSNVVVEPLLGNIMWDQGFPFDQLCPSGTPVGCVATAMAQVMYYWRWPEQGMGQHTYKYGGITHTVDFSAATYDWDLMYDRYDGSNSEAANDEVAKLSYHCGVSIDMQYGAGGSGAWTEYLSHALTNYFSYNPNCGIAYRTDMSYTDWTAALNRELLEGRPIIFAGTSDQGGHAFVIDGINAEGLYHVNWGWGGYYNGYYDICILNPSGVGTGAAISELGFCMDQTAMLFVTPEVGCGEPICPVRFDGSWLSYDPAFPLADLTYYVMNCSNARTEGVVGYELTDASDLTIFTAMTDTITLGSVYNWGYYAYVNQQIDYTDLADGTYSIHPLFQPLTPDAPCTRMTTNCYDNGLCQFDVVDGNIVSAQHSRIQYDLLASGFSLQGQQLAAGKPYVATIDITNRSTEDYNGSLALVPAEEHSHQLAIPTEGNRIFIAAGATVTAQFPILIDEEGQFDFILECYNRNVGLLSQCQLDDDIISFSVAFTDESPAHLTLSSPPIILTERCVPDEEIAFQFVVNNQGGNFSDQIGLLFFGRSTSTTNPLVTVTDSAQVMMQQSDLLIEIHTPLTGVKAMTKYYARPAYLDAYGDFQLMRVDNKLADPIEVKVYAPTAIEQVNAETEDSSAPLYDLYGRRAEASRPGFMVNGGRVLLK